MVSGNKQALIMVWLWSGAVSRMLFEEHLVAARYPEYRQYAVNTWRMVPLVF